MTCVDMNSRAKIKIRHHGKIFFVSTSGKNDYIHSDGANSVSCVVDESKKFTYTNHELKYSRGIDIDYRGNIYILLDINLKTFIKLRVTGY